jgi:putative ABC transport system permease protein
MSLLDLRFALRSFARRPAFTAITVLTLGLGIGGATAVFSIVDAVLLRPLPYRDPDRLTAIWVTSTREQALAKLFATHADYVQFRDHSTTLSDVSAATWAKQTGRVLTGRGPARDVLTIPATASFFETLGVSAAMGRTFRAEDESRGCSILLAHRFWSTTLAADPSIVGQSLTLDRNPCTVLGVMPESFQFYPRQAQMWILLGPNFQPAPDMLVGIFARLKPGVTRAQAEAELHRLYRAIHPSGETRDFEPTVNDLRSEFTFLAGRTLRVTLIVVFAAVLLVLLIACLNVANLLLARLSERERELAVRAAMGSGQGRLLRQLLTESLLLSGGGAVLGVAMAWGLVRYFRYANPIELTVGADVGVNLPVLAFGVGLSIATTLIFGLIPAIRASRVDLTQHLRAAGRGSVPSRSRLAGLLIAAEMGISFLLLTGAGLLMTSALRMGSEHLGFDPDRLVAARITLPPSRYPGDASRLRTYEELVSRLERLRGAAGAALASKLPPQAGGNQTLEIRGRTAGDAALHDIGADAVSPGFFDLLRIPLRRGRAFTAQDRDRSQLVTIVNEALAREYFPNSDPLDQQIRIPGGMQWLTIVGVCGNLKHTQLMNEMSWAETPILYRPLAQEPRPTMEIAVRVAGGAGSVGREIQHLIEATDSSLPIAEPELLTTRLSKTLAYPRFRAVVLGLFAAGALLLSAIGLHGVLSQVVARRTAEFGVRRAVGAQTHHLLMLVARQGGVPVIAGMAAGAGATLAFRRALSNLLYGIGPDDPAALALVSLVLMAVAAVAILAPALRAARVDPMVALREE